MVSACSGCFVIGFFVAFVVFLITQLFQDIIYDTITKIKRFFDLK